MIVRGTTPYHTFILPIASSSIKEVWVTYLQNGVIILNKKNGDSGVTFEEVNLETENAHVEDYESNEEIVSSTQLTVHLTQEETLAFKFYPAAEKNIAVVQIRILDQDDEAYASDPIRERIFGVLKDEVIGNDQNTNSEIGGE